jgi:hypothetical protein
MVNKKLALVSIGAGIVTFVSGFLGLLLIYRLLSSPQWMFTIIFWILAWPILLLTRVFRVPYLGSALVLALSSGVIANVAILSGIFYLLLTLLRRKTPTPPLPPRPVPFE